MTTANNKVFISAIDNLALGLAARLDQKEKTKFRNKHLKIREELTLNVINESVKTHARYIASYLDDTVNLFLKYSK